MSLERPEFRKLMFLFGVIQKKWYVSSVCFPSFTVRTINDVFNEEMFLTCTTLYSQY